MRQEFGCGVRVATPLRSSKTPSGMGAIPRAEAAQARQGKGCLNMYFNFSFLVFIKWNFSDLVLSKKAQDLIR